MRRNIVYFIFICFLFVDFINTYAQDTDMQTITGTVIDTVTREPITGVNIILKSDVLTGTTTNGEGKFHLQVTREQFKNDSVIVSFVGYTEKTLSILTLRKKGTISLSQRSHKLKETVVTGRRIIAEEFTIKHIERRDIYLNPVSKADPLLAVNAMPASTTTDESANISLRGSSPAETGIFFNDVPVYDAVKFSQLNGIGKFSIFNTSIIERMHVFPSNPPLEYGNTSSGLISIQSTNTIPEENRNSLTLSLANIGIQTSRRISSKTGGSIFANYQPSAGLIGVNERALNNLEHFYSGDLGVHTIHRFNDSSMVKFFNYSNLEGYQYNYSHASFDGTFEQDKKRNFTIMNYIRHLNSGNLTVNSGVSFSGGKYNYGNTDINLKKQNVYFNVNYQHYFDNVSIKTGVSHDSRKHDIEGRTPVFSYAMGSEHPSFKFSDIRKINLSEAFLYSRYDLNPNWVVGAGIRKNFFTKNQKDYWSGQCNVNYSFRENHSINVSAGRYHNYAMPNAETDTKKLYQSDQVSFDYKFDNQTFEVASAIFAKQTEFENISENIRGAELFTKVYLFGNSFNIQGSYTLIDAQRENTEITYPTQYDMDYFIRGRIKYQTPRNLSVSLITLYRHGTYYRPVIDRNYDNSLNVYKPVYASRNNMRRYPDYLKLDMSVSKLWSVSRDMGVITFVNVSNILDHDNVRDKTYNSDYTESTYEYYSKRTIYFGATVRF